MPLKNCYTIAVDAMGGDYGPEVTIPAALIALEQYEQLTLILVGDEILIAQQLQRVSDLPQDRYQVHHASQRVEMDESPMLALRNKRDSSMRVAIDLVQQGLADACVSAGNTGALMAIARFVLKTLPGIDRPAISALFPTSKSNQGVRLLDLGANVDVRIEHLLQFAVMGAVLSAEVDQVPKPRLALLNIGSEAGKGNAQVRKTGELLASHAGTLNYTGYIEANALFQGHVDVVVCDGFVGNVALKTTEGVIQLMNAILRQTFHKNWIMWLMGLMVKPFLKRASRPLDPTRHNGASLVGLRGIVVKSHGSADTLAFTYALYRAVTEIERAVPERIQARIASFLQTPTALSSS